MIRHFYEVVYEFVNHLQIWKDSKNLVVRERFTSLTRSSVGGLGLWLIQMVEGVEPLTHDQSLPPLDGHLLLGQWSEEDWWHDEVHQGPVLDGWSDSGSAGLSEEALLDVEHVESNKEGSSNGGALDDLFSVVHSVNYCFVYLPSVFFHIKGY